MIFALFLFLTSCKHEAWAAVTDNLISTIIQQSNIVPCLGIKLCCFHVFICIFTSFFWLNIERRTHSMDGVKWNRHCFIYFQLNWTKIFVFFFFCSLHLIRRFGFRIVGPNGDVKKNRKVFDWDYHISHNYHIVWAVMEAVYQWIRGYHHHYCPHYQVCSNYWFNFSKFLLHFLWNNLVNEHFYFLLSIVQDFCLIHKRCIRAIWRHH